MKLAILILFLSLMPFSVFSWGKKDQSSGPQTPPAENAEAIDAGNQAEGSMENAIKIRGRVQIYGNVPHTYVGIVDADGKQYSVHPPSQEERLISLQGHLIEFTVLLLDEPQGYGSLFLRGGTVTPLEWEIIQ